MKLVKLKCGYIFDSTSGNITELGSNNPIKDCKCYFHHFPLDKIELTELEKAIYETD